MDLNQLSKAIANWLIQSLQQRPIASTIVLGVISYSAGLFIFVVLMSMDYKWLLVGTTAGAIPIVTFHWFVSRFERTSNIAQLLQVLPAVGFVGLAFLFAQGIVASQICYTNADSRELVCHID